MTFTFSGAGTLGTIIEGILYGAYAVLFTLYLILWRRNNRGFGGALTLAQMLLFCLCTLSLCFDISVDYLLVVPDAKNSDAANKLNLGSMVLFALIDCMAQAAKLYRCWIIWDRRWVVVAVPGFLVLITLGGAFALVGLDNSPLWKIDEARAIHLCKSTGIATNTVSLVVNALTKGWGGVVGYPLTKAAGTCPVGRLTAAKRCVRALPLHFSRRSHSGVRTSGREGD
ncbi:hypothetical protein BD779DRAFT_1675392 [Infundibulicybe gibba]|nr:hypothetical protein BD779DRAFT_1675392 [Infundibulicybe gibba]